MDSVKGICIEDSISTVLEVGKTYFLLENGPNHFYVSRTININAHCGCFKKDYFQLLNEIVEPQNTEPELLPIEEWEQTSLF